MKYAAKKLCTLIITLFIVSLLAFLAFQVIPGDPTTQMLGTEATEEARAALRAELGLDRPDFIVAMLVILVLIASDLVLEKRAEGPALDKLPLPVRWVIYLLLIFAVLIFGVYGPNYEATAFIYFAF